MNLQKQLEKIHHQFGVSEKANYEIEKLFEEQISKYQHKALKWDELHDKIAKCYGIENEDGEWEEDEDGDSDLTTIGEISAEAFGFM